MHPDFSPYDFTFPYNTNANNTFGGAVELDISDEDYRRYRFSNYDVVTIKKPVALQMLPDGSHRIINEKDKIYQIPAGWMYIETKLKSTDG